MLRHPGYNALGRLLRQAGGDTEQARFIANFLLAWYNTPENCGRNPGDIGNVQVAVADDMIKVLELVYAFHVYPDQLGLGQEFEALWQRWRSI